MPAATPAHRGKQLRSWLAVWFAVLLAIAPVARPSLPVQHSAAGDGSVQSFDLRDQPTAKAEEPGSRLRSAQPAAPGILSRLLPVETTFGLPPLKPALAWSDTAQALPVAPGPIVASIAEISGAFHRSSVGTARTPTGPPS